MKGFLDYIPGDSIIHKLDLRTKILLAFMICVGCFVSDSILFLLGLLIIDLLIGALGGIFNKALKLLKGLLKISIFLFVLQVLFIRHGNALFTLLFGFAITDDGVITAVRVVLRLISATLPLALMLTLTKMNDLSNTLVGKCHIPYKYAFAITSAIRFIPAFSGDMQAIMEAQTARGVEFDTRNFAKKIKLVIPLCVPLLVSSVQKIDSVAIAAELRGFHLRNKNSCYKLTKFEIRDYSTLLLGVFVVVLAFYL